MRLRDLPGGNKLVGIRHQVHDEPDADWLYGRDVRVGIETVFAHDLAYDFLVRSRELPAAIATARAYPQGRFVLDHAAKPPIATASTGNGPTGSPSSAAAAMSGARSPALRPRPSWDDWDAARLLPSVTYAARCFGEDRLIFGSDWPVCLLAGSYGVITQALSQCLAQQGPGFHDKAFGANATAAYRLKP